LNLGIDFDGTIADSTQEKIRAAREMFGVAMRPEHAGRAPGRRLMGRQRYDAVARSIYSSEKTLELPPVDEATEGIRSLSGRYNLYVVTARDKKQSELASTWLLARSLPITGVLYTSESGKRAACESHGIGVILDDTPEVLADFTDAGIVPVLLSRPYNLGARLAEGARRASSWRDFVDLVDKL